DESTRNTRFRRRGERHTNAFGTCGTKVRGIRDLADSGEKGITGLGELGTFGTKVREIRGSAESAEKGNNG
ncbi:hypothetical protein KI387_002092, partial [Taxus chinensis]